MMVGQPCLFDVVLPPEQITLEEAREELEPFKSKLEKRGFEKMTLGIYILPDSESYEEAEWIYDSVHTMDYFKDPKWVALVYTEKTQRRQMRQRSYDCRAEQVPSCLLRQGHVDLKLREQFIVDEKHLVINALT